MGRNPGKKIIPARAGFTYIDKWGEIKARDHPRSRGVYKTVPACDSTLLRSSPLARGLRQCSPVGVALAEIIPARAGFTADPCTPIGPYQDHPRSRGVYRARTPGAHPDVRSSPLARGLPARPAGGGVHREIIPARAGFTRRSLPLLQGGEDHPRSRGVYATTIWTACMVLRSSPLARGLHVATARPAGGGEIIPARAGFTEVD